MSNQMKSVMKNWMRGLAMLGIVIGTVHIPKAAVANGAGLPAGTYTMRVSDEQPTVPVGQAPDAAPHAQRILQRADLEPAVLERVMSTNMFDLMGLPRPVPATAQP